MDRHEKKTNMSLKEEARYTVIKWKTKNTTVRPVLKSNRKTKTTTVRPVLKSNRKTKNTTVRPVLKSNKKTKTNTLSEQF
jgi:hypothetical protein